jgi:hypothetical protein
MKKNTRKEEQLYAEFLRRMTEYNREDEDFGAGMFRSVILAAVVVTIVTAAIYLLTK